MRSENYKEWLHNPATRKVLGLMAALADLKEWEALQDSRNNLQSGAAPSAAQMQALGYALAYREFAELTEEDLTALAEHIEERDEELGLEQLSAVLERGRR